MLPTHDTNINNPNQQTFQGHNTPFHSSSSSMYSRTAEQTNNHNTKHLRAINTITIFTILYDSAITLTQPPCIYPHKNPKKGRTHNTPRTYINVLMFHNKKQQLTFQYHPFFIILWCLTIATHCNCRTNTTTTIQNISVLSQNSIKYTTQKPKTHQPSNFSLTFRCIALC